MYPQVWARRHSADLLPSIRANGRETHDSCGYPRDLSRMIGADTDKSGRRVPSTLGCGKWYGWSPMLPSFGYRAAEESCPQGPEGRGHLLTYTVGSYGMTAKGRVLALKYINSASIVSMCGGSTSLAMACQKCLRRRTRSCRDAKSPWLSTRHLVFGRKWVVRGGRSAPPPSSTLGTRMDK